MLQDTLDSKLRHKEKESKSLTSLRQNNEVNIQNLKKIVKYIIDSYQQEVMSFKVLAFDMQEIMKTHLSNLMPNQTMKDFCQLQNMPTSSIEFITKTVEQRVQLLTAKEPEPQIMTSAVKKRPKSSAKITGGTKKDFEKLDNLNQSILASRKSPSKKSEVFSPEKAKPVPRRVTSAGGMRPGSPQPIQTRKKYDPNQHRQSAASKMELLSPVKKQSLNASMVSASKL